MNRKNEQMLLMYLGLHAHAIYSDVISFCTERILFGSTPLPNHMYFETDFKVFKIYFQYLNTILLYFNPV